MKPNPRDSANAISKFTFWWLYPILFRGCRKPLEKADLYRVQVEDGSLKMANLVGGNWAKELKEAKEQGRRASFMWALMMSFGGRYLRYGKIIFLEECIFKISVPILLCLYIRYFNNASEYSSIWGYLIVVGIFIASIGAVITQQLYFYYVQWTGMQIRIASCAVIYRKALRLNMRVLSQTTVGQLVNLLSNDVSRFDSSVLYFHYLWVGPSQVILTTLILWYEFGLPCLAGMGILLLGVIVMSSMGKVFSKLRLATALRTDERVRIMNEIVNAIQVIKMYAWELPFRKIVEEARRLESRVIFKSSFLRAVTCTLFLTLSKVMAFLILLVYVLMGNKLTADKVFLTCSLINCINLSMNFFFFSAISFGSETFGSCARIQRFLEMEEREECEKVVKCEVRPKPENCLVEVHGICAQWDEADLDDTLSDITFTVVCGEIMSVIGPVGSGKSSLLHALLGELPIRKGTALVQGRVAYVCQEPWLFPATIRDNILFGQSFGEKRYKEVLRVCALDRDLEQLPEGDKTKIGERGVTLSGEQRARIGLARAVYYDGDIYLLDDPLSAVEEHVGKYLFEQCISKYLKNKVVILATHQLQFVKKTHHTLCLRNGRVEATGTFDSLRAKGVDFAGIIAESVEDLSNTEGVGKDPISLRKIALLKRATKTWMSHNPDPSTENVPEPRCLEEIEEPKEHPVTVNEELESKYHGSVSIKVYFEYFLAGGGVCVIMLLLLLSCLCEISNTTSGYWLSYWTNMEHLRGDTNPPSNDTIWTFGVNATSIIYPVLLFVQDRENYVFVYTTITVVLLMTTLFRNLLFFGMCVTSSRTLHNRMFAAIIRSPMRFFETHSIGQILNRFSKDVGQVDDLLTPALYDFLSIMSIFFGIIGMVIVLNYWMSIPTLVIGVIFILLRWIYRSFAREIKRLEGTTKSSVFSYLGATLHGLSTVRAYKAQQTATRQFDAYQDIHTSAWYLFISSARIFGIYLDILCAIYISIAALLFMFKENVLGGDVGLSISLVMMLSWMFQWGVKQSAEVENHMTSVERIVEFSRMEPEEVSQDTGPEFNTDAWPTKGGITFEDVYLKYNDNDLPVLKGLSFEIQPAEKVGIVGRTGAGKSSLLTCLFRLSPIQGNIMIDGVPTDNVPLDDLRRALSIIPQEPTLFTGTVRHNLDPFSIYTDREIWNALEEVQLKEAVSEMYGKLDAQISEGGSNLSLGQRQLLCLSRAILKRNKILVMDEATANVDPETDKFIQTTIRHRFRDCTVITIAHRLHSIMDSDRVMVIDSGNLMEFDSPFQLLQKKNSMFCQLVNQSGLAVSQHLKHLAQEAFHRSLRKTESVTASPAESVCTRFSSSESFQYSLDSLRGSRDSHNTHL